MISIIIPCRNEERFIADCIDSVLAQDYPEDRLEVLFLDGQSTDRTREIIQEYAKSHKHIRLLDNPHKTVPYALNKGIKEAAGEIIIRLDAHALYPPDYVSKCVKYLNDYKVDNAGGICVTLPGAQTLTAKTIALAISNPFGVGNSYFRIGVKEPKFVDTVPFGCHRRETFDRIGLFDEDLVRNQDAEFNHRLIKSGGRILLVPDVVSYYYARATFTEMAAMYSRNGYFKALTAIKLNGVFTVRQIVPALFVTSLILLGIGGVFSPVLRFLLYADIGLYLLADIAVSARLSFKNDRRMFPLFVWAFLLIHFTFGFNYLRGVIMNVARKKYRQQRKPQGTIK